MQKNFFLRTISVVAFIAVIGILFVPQKVLGQTVYNDDPADASCGDTAGLFKNWDDQGCWNDADGNDATSYPDGSNALVIIDDGNDYGFNSDYDITVDSISISSGQLNGRSELSLKIEDGIDNSGTFNGNNGETIIFNDADNDGDSYVTGSFGSSNNVSNIKIRGSGTKVIFDTAVEVTNSIAIENETTDPELELNGKLTLTGGAFTVNGKFDGQTNSKTVEFSAGASQTVEGTPSQLDFAGFDIDNNDDVILDVDPSNLGSAPYFSLSVSGTAGDLVVGSTSNLLDIEASGSAPDSLRILDGNTLTLSGNLSIGGDLTVGGTYNPSGNKTIFNGGTDQEVNQPSSNAPDDLSFAKLDVNNGNSLTIDISSSNLSNGSFSIGDIAGTSGDLIVGNSNSPTVEIQGTSSPSVVGNLSIDNGSTLTLDGSTESGTALDVDGDVTVTSGTLTLSGNTGGGLNVTGTLTVNDNFNPNDAAETLFDGGSAQSVLGTPSAGFSLGTVDVENGNSLTIDIDATNLSGNVPIADLQGGSGDLILEDSNGGYTAEMQASTTSQSVVGNLDIKSNSTLTLDGSAKSTDNLDVDGAVTLNGGLTLSSGSGGGLEVSGNFTDDGTFTTNGSPTTFNGTTTIGGASTTQFAKVTVSSGNSATVGTDIEISGNLQNDGTFTYNGSDGNRETVTFNGGAGQDIQGSEPTFDRLTITDNGSNKTTLFLSQPITVDGLLTIGSNAELDQQDDSQNGGIVTANGSFENNGTYTSDGRKFILNASDGNREIRGTSTTTFHTLEVQDGGAGNTIFVESSTEISDELILTGGTLDADGSGDSSLDGNGNLTLLSTAEEASARIASSGTGTISGDVSIERFVDRKDGGEDDSHWRQLASPLGGSLDEPDSEHDVYNGPELLSNTWTQGAGMTGANSQVSSATANVYFYDEAADVGTDLAQGWNALDDLTNPTGETGIASQEGFLVYLYTDRNYDGTNEGFPITLTATGGVSDTENNGSDIPLPVSCTDNDGSGSDGCTDDYDGWNLVTNPFVSHFDWTSGSVSKTALKTNAYVYDSDNSEYDQTDGTNGGDAFIAPFQAFFVKSDASGGNEGTVSLSVNSNAKADPNSPTDRQFKTAGSASPLVSLQITDGDRTEETRVTFTDQAKSGEDTYDGYQLTPLDSEYILLASQIEGDTSSFDSQYRPQPSDSLTIDLVVDVTSSGTYTIEGDSLANLPSDWSVTLVDTQDNTTADLQAGESLTFTTDKSTTKRSSESSPVDLLKNGPVHTKAAKASTSLSDRFQLEIKVEGALPVELNDVSGRAEKQDVILTWETASETNNAGFQIQRKEDGSFVDLESAFVEGAGTTDQPQSYRYRAEDLDVGAHTFRLKQVDTDGAVSFSDPIDVKVGLAGNYQLTTYPNPVRERATVEFAVKEKEDVTVVLYNTLGQRVKTLYRDTPPAEQTQRVPLTTDDLSSGLYIVRLKGTSFTATQRVTVVK